MKGPNQNRALFDAITNIDDDLIDEAAAPRVLKFPDVVRKIAAVAAVLAIICTLFLLDGKESPMPFFSVYVYASETESVELTPNGTTTAVSNVAKNERPLFGSSVGNGDEDREPVFCTDIVLNDSTKDYRDIEVWCNDKCVDLSVGGIFILHTMNTELNKVTGLSVVGTVEQASVIEIILYGEDGVVLQQYVLKVEPAHDGYKVELEKSYVADTE